MDSNTAYVWKVARAYADAVGLDLRADGYETVLGDLLCDLHHLADEYGADWDEVLRRAAFHYENEIEEAIQ